MKQYIVDAFTDTLFHGNQAAVCVLDQWLTENVMMNITRENNFSETAFTVKTQDGYDLRWFTPGGEINLCGHATLGTAYILFHYYERETDCITFHTLSGDLYVRRNGDAVVMDFPAYQCREIPVIDAMEEAMGVRPLKAYIDRDLLLVYGNEEIIRSMEPDFGKVRLLEGDGVGVTAPGKNYDCVSRFFAPRLKVNEDPVTGSIHCMITPYWAKRLGKNKIHAYQASERGGVMDCELRDGRVIISGDVTLYAVDELYLQDKAGAGMVRPSERGTL